MPTLQNKIDFILTIDVDNANPNGDPLSGNMPRTDAKTWTKQSSYKQTTVSTTNSDLFKNVSKAISIRKIRIKKSLKNHVNTGWMYEASDKSLLIKIALSVYADLYRSLWRNPLNRLSYRACKSHAARTAWKRKKKAVAHQIQWVWSTMSNTPPMSLKDPLAPTSLK